MVKGQDLAWKWLIVITLKNLKMPTKINTYHNINQQSQMKEKIQKNKDYDSDLCVWDEDDIQKDFKESKNVIFLRFLFEKSIHKNSVFSDLSNIWCDPAELESSLYRILLNNPIVTRKNI